jgi:carbon-monoxide dehydrogenase small subunit
MSTPMETIEISLVVNGERVKRAVSARMSLADFLRTELELTGTHVGCEHGVCGACTVRVDGEIVRGCLMFAVQADGSEVDTIEGLSDSREVEELQSAFVLTNAIQCGFCSPGVLMAAQALLRDEPNPSRERIREYLSGNYCRCTGYQAIVDAIEAVARARASRGEHGSRR